MTEQQQETPKRLREDGNDGNEPVAKKARNDAPERLHLVFGVQVTRFKDDYKARGSDWSETTMDVVYATHELAEIAAHAEKRSFIEEYLENRMDDTLAAEYCYSKDSDDEDSDYTFNDVAVDEDFEMLLDKAQEGEFVPRRFEVSIVPMSIVYADII